MSEVTAAMKQHGAFSWNELMTSDLDGAKSFYQAIFGWTLEKMDMEGVEYSIGSAGDTQVSGMMTTPAEAEGMPPMWGGYVTVDDVEASARQVVELGGKVLIEPKDIPKVGRFCVIQDPQGAVLSIITYGEQ